MTFSIGIILAISKSMVLRSAILFLVALSVLSSPSKAAEQRMYQDRLRVRATDTVHLGQLVDGRVCFRQAENENNGKAVRVLVEGSARIEPGESIEAAEQRAVLDALTRVFQANKVNNAYLVESTSVHNYTVVHDAVQIEFDYILQPGLTIINRRIVEDSVVVTLRAPIQTPVHREENNPGPDAWKDAYDEMNRSARTLFKYRSETARTMSLWMNRIGSAVRDIIP